MKRSVQVAATFIVLALSPIAFAAEPCRMETDLTWREKKLERELREAVEGRKRYVDTGVILRVVVADPNGEELIPSKPKLRVLREHRWGCLVDTHSEPPCPAGASKDPVVWYASEDQEAVLLHDDPNVPGQIIKGSEGAGKTHVLAMLHYRWWQQMLGERREVGQTAPTKKRLRHVLRAMDELYPSTWFSYNKKNEQVTFCDGHTVTFLTTRQQSAAEGSKVQGYGLSAAGRDELQDQVEADEDIESRGRNAKLDRRTGTIHYRQAATCTAKQSSAFVSMVARKLSSGKWVQRLLLIARSPFIHPSFLAEKKLVMTDREFRRRYLAEDLAPEHMLYFNWERAHHLRPIPRNAKPITRLVLSAKTFDKRHALLVGNDPGILKAASVFLEAFEVPGVADPVWWVRGELVTFHQTTEVHAGEVLNICRDRFGCNLPGRRDDKQAHVRSHPYGQAKDKPSLDVYRIFGRVGLDIKAAQYTKKGTGTGTIKLDDRLEMVNCLLLDAAGRTRLYVECDARMQPAAPRLVEAFETLERTEEGDPEDEKKNLLDKTDPADALGNGLWAFEKEAVQQARLRARQKAA